MNVKAAFSLTTLLISVLGIGQLSAQAPTRQPTLVSESFICNYTGRGFDPQAICNYMAYKSSGHAERVVDRILKPIGLMRNFKIMECANTQNCFATVLKGQRFIIYDGAFMQRIEDMTETDWSAISVMAHEIGHHLQGHTIDGKGGQPQKEIEADKFSGFVLHQLGASLDESLVAVKALGDEHATSTHPAKPARIDAIRKGWLEAEELYPKWKTANRPAVATAPKPIADDNATASTRPAVPTRTAPTRTTTRTVGCISGDCKDGRGVFVYPTLERYAGEFEEGDKHGAGTEYYSDGKLKYKGNFRDNVRSDYGVYFYRNGDRYAGWFQKNVPSGKGTYYFADGDRFVGSFKNGQRHGYGTLYNADGTKEEEGVYEQDEKVR